MQLEPYSPDAGQPPRTASPLCGLLDLISDLAIACATDGQILHHNPAVTAFRGDDAGCMPWSDEWQDLFERLSKAGDGVSLECLMHDGAARDRLIRWRTVELPGTTQEQQLLVALGTDITLCPDAPHPARSLASLLDNLLNSPLSCKALLDRDYNVRWSNANFARAREGAPGMLGGKSILDVLPERDRDALGDPQRSAGPVAGRCFKLGSEALQDGEPTWWDWSLQPITGQAGDVEQYLLSFNDRSAEQHELCLRDRTIERMRARVSRELLDAQERERRRIARELHDEIGQGLTIIKLAALNSIDEHHPASPQCKQVITEVNELLHAVRRIAQDLRPPLLDDLGLLAGLSWLIDRQAQSGLRVRLRHNGLGQRLLPEVETATFRICQEALANVSRHAGVESAELAVWVFANSLVLRVEDHGCGFDSELLTRSSAGFGLIGMRERCELLGGTLTVDTLPGVGTTVTAELPLEPRYPPNELGQ